MKKIEIIWITLLITLSTLLGFLYSIHHTDSHHWGFIVGTALDFIEGKKLFSEVYVQYGVGQLLLFKFLNSFLPINFTSVGFITSIFYSLHLLIIYLGVKKISNGTLAILITSTAFFVHTFSIYPWSDYYAGFFLSLSCYLMMGFTEEKNFSRSLLVGLTLFITIIFRNTYFFSILLAGITYAGLCKFKKEKLDKNLITSLLAFVSLTFSYVIFIFLQGNFHAWFSEGIGTASSGQYHLEFTSILHLLQRAFIPLKFTQPNYFSLLTIALFLYLALITIKRTTSFFALLALAGLIQALHGYEVFRVQNACASIYFVAAIFLNTKFPHLSFRLKERKFAAVLAIFFLVHLARFPYASAYFPVFEGGYGSYTETNIPYFKWHRLHSEEKKYYEELAQAICGKNKIIINYTMDSVVPYLCNVEGSNQIENAFSLAFYYEEMIRKINPAALNNANAGLFEESTVIISERASITNNNPLVKLVEVAQTARPGTIRFIKGSPIHVFRVTEN